MQKHKKGNWKRPVAGLLAVLLATGTILILQFDYFKPYRLLKTTEFARIITCTVIPVQTVMRTSMYA